MAITCTRPTLRCCWRRTTLRSSTVLLINAVDDAAAALWAYRIEVYRNGSQLMVRVT